jgi:hypothetical protein
MMDYRSKLDMKAVQREVQLHLQQLRNSGLQVPASEKPLHRNWMAQPSVEVSGFAEAPPQLKKSSELE